ncbi:MAG: hypothetical protein U0326_12330 [Polyangiales bacterium]
MLARDAKVYWRAVSPAPGEDLLGRVAGARRRGRRGGAPRARRRPRLRDRRRFTAAIDRMRDDPSRCFIPVYLDAEAERRKR